jgi:anti-sigma regulatory factor (Ser/Thr protein kinase)
MASNMATVELTFSARPVHVRTARLIVTAVARRSGVAESLLDEVRLAVGEACSRAVEAHQRNCPEEPVRLELNDGNHRFEVVVSDNVPGDDATGGVPATAPSDGSPAPGSPSGGSPVSGTAAAGRSDAAAWDEVGAAELGLAVIAGLADDVMISSTSKGVEIRMSWPTGSDR